MALGVFFYNQALRLPVNRYLLFKFFHLSCRTFSVWAPHHPSALFQMFIYIIIAVVRGLGSAETVQDGGLAHPARGLSGSLIVDTLSINGFVKGRNFIRSSRTSIAIKVTGTKHSPQKLSLRCQPPLFIN